MNFNISPAIIAATIAGSGIGSAVGFMSKGEQAENQGASTSAQFKQSSFGGLSGGFVGAGIGLGVSGTAVALKKILGK
jgi:hypothetical protein